MSQHYRILPKTVCRSLRRADGKLLCLLAFLVAGFLSFPCAAQVLYGTVTGTVTDASGAAVPNARVDIFEQNTGIKKTVQANGDGVYNATDLQPGTYSIQFSAPGFASFNQRGETLSANQVLRLDASLKVGGIQQTVTVSAAPPSLQTEEASVNYNISTEQIADLPTTSSTGRNVQSLYRLIPGSTPPAEANSAGANPQRSQPINVNGQSYDSNTQRLDGAVDQNPWLPDLVAYMPPPDAIQAINVVTASFNAEEGSAGGAAVNYTIRSGTNQFHGAAWGYNSISQFNAHQWQNRVATLPKNIYNEDGFSLGGPILKDKLFFFGDFNRVTTRTTLSGTFSVPTEAMRSGNFAALSTIIYDPATGNSSGQGKTPFFENMIPLPRISSAASQLLASLPLPSPGLANNTTNNYLGTAVYGFNRNTTDLKINYNPTQATTLFGRYSFSPNSINDPQVFGPNPGGPTIDGGQPGAATGRIQNLGLGATHVFSPHFAIDANAGFTRMRIGAASTDLSLGDYGANQLQIPGTNYNGQALYAGIPAFTFNTYTSLGNSTTSNPFKFRDMVYTGNLNGTYTHNHHSFRFGGEYLHSQINHFQAGSATAVSTNPRGSFGFNGNITAASGASGNNINSFADFLLGQAVSYNKGVQVENPLTLRFSSFAFYAQDTWTIGRLNVDYGVRYEYYPLPVSDHYDTVRYDPSQPISITDSNGTHTVGTVLVGGEGGVPSNAGIANGWGMVVPRLGLTYRVYDGTVVRAGYGITVDPNSLRSVLNQYPGAVATSASNTSTAVTSLNTGLLSTTTTVGIPAFAIPSFSQGKIPLPSTISTFTIPQNFRRGYIESYNLSVQQQLPARMVTSLAYVGAQAIRQQSYLNINASPIGGGTTTGRELNVLYGANTNNTDIIAAQPLFGANFNGLEAQLSRNGSRYVDFGIVYTFSKSINSEDNTQNGLAFNYPAYWTANRAVASTDRTNNLQFWTTEHTPFGKEGMYLKQGAIGYVLGGWQLSTILGRTSGTPFLVTANPNASQGTAGNTTVADIVPGMTKLSRTDVNGFRQYLNPAAYTAPGGVRLGTSGRNSVRGPGIFDLDASIRREFPIREALQFVFQAESFNLTNTPSFSNPSANVSSPSTFGIITAAGSGRTMRLSGRIEF